MKKQIREQDIYYFDSGEQEDTALCAGMLRQMIAEIMRRENRKGVLLFCIGTDRSTGDSLGPLIGHKLKRAGLKDRRDNSSGDTGQPGSCHESGTGNFYGTALLSGSCDRGGGCIGRSDRACGLHYPGEGSAPAGAWRMQGTAGGGRYLYYRHCGRIWKL